MVEAVCALGFAARFVSGYLYVPARDEPDRRGGGSTHAKCQVYLPGPAGSTLTRLTVLLETVTLSASLLRGIRAKPCP